MAFKRSGFDSLTSTNGSRLLGGFFYSRYSVGGISWRGACRDARNYLIVDRINNLATSRGV